MSIAKDARRVTDAAKLQQQAKDAEEERKRQEDIEVRALQLWEEVKVAITKAAKLGTSSIDIEVTNEPTETALRLKQLAVDEELRITDNGDETRTFVSLNW